MSFTRVKPSNWSVGEGLTSAQMNSLDIDHANSLDKSTAGDSILGIVQIASGAQIQVPNGGGTIVSARNAGIQATVAGGIASAIQGGIALGGGANDYVTFNTAHTRTLAVAAVPYGGLASGWLLALPPGRAAAAVAGPATTQIQTFLLPTHNGATLSSIDVYIAVQSHANVPSVLPTVSVFRMPQLSPSNTLSATSDLSSSPSQSFSPVPANGAAWTFGGAYQAWTYTCNQNNVIDNTAYCYFLSLTDENGANSVAGNVYPGFVMHFTGITSAQFP